MEHFGTGQLSAGHIVITIEPGFAETVSGSGHYHVFLTAKGELINLYVTNETATSFEVRGSDGGNTSIDFNYRIVAKRRSMEGQRLSDVTDK